MSDVAAASGNVTVKAGAAAGAGTGKPKSSAGAGALEGAFAAIFGVAAGKSPGGANVSALITKGGPVADQTGLPGTDAGAAAELAVAPQIAVAEGDPALTETGDKPRKGSKARAKTDEEPDLTAAEAQLVASAATAPGEAKPVVDAGTSNASSAKAVAAPGTGTEGKAKAKAEVAAKVADEGKSGQAIAAMQITKEGETARSASSAPVVPSTAHGTAAKPAQASAQAVTHAAGAASDVAINGQGAGDTQDQGQKHGAGKGGSPIQAAIGQMAANDEGGDGDDANSLSDIMRSLPPGIQSQLATQGTPAVDNIRGGAPVAATGELLGDKVIDMTVSGQWVDRMAREIASLAEGTGHSRFQLNPPNLGRIQIDLWQGDDKMNLRMLTETDEAARRLREGQNSLATHARVASLSLGSVSVEKSQAPLDSNRDHGQGQNQRQQAETGGNAQQQASAQAQGQSGQGRSGAQNSSGGRGAPMSHEPQAEAGQVARTDAASDPRVRFA